MSVIPNFAESVTLCLVYFISFPSQILFQRRSSDFEGSLALFLYIHACLFKYLTCDALQTLFPHCTFEQLSFCRLYLAPPSAHMEETRP